MLAVLVLGLELEQVQERGQLVLDQLVLQALAQLGLVLERGQERGLERPEQQLEPALVLAQGLGLILEREQELGQLVLQALAQQLVCHLTLRE